MRERIEAAISRLSPSERKVAERVAADPEAAIGATIAELARAAGVSEPTVLRFCRSIGLEGFAELRLALARGDGEDRRPRRAPPRPIGPGMRVEEAAAAVLDGHLAALHALRRDLDAAALERAALALLRAARVEVWGCGASAAATLDLAHRLFPVCRGVVARSDPEMQAMAAAALDGDAVALCLSRTGRTRALVEMARAAAAAGATVVALTRPGSPLASAATLLVPAGTAEEDEDDVGLGPPLMAARVAQLALGDALAVAAALLSPPAAAARIARMEAALKARRME